MTHHSSHHINPPASHSQNLNLTFTGAYPTNDLSCTSSLLSLKACTHTPVLWTLNFVFMLVPFAHISSFLSHARPQLQLSLPNLFTLSFSYIFYSRPAFELNHTLQSPSNVFSLRRMTFTPHSHVVIPHQPLRIHITQGRSPTLYLL